VQLCTLAPPTALVELLLLMKTPILRWAVYLIIGATVFVAVRWLGAPVDGHAVTASSRPAEKKEAASPATTQNSAWLTDLKTAQDQAKTTHKFLLLNFTGSDWCGFCIQLDRAIFSKPDFKDYASKNLILVELDYPRRKAQNIDIKKQNAILAERYQIEAFPTLIILNENGKLVWRYEGLYQGSLAAFLADLDKVRKG
jgi:protein disulfide-isomerase